MGGCMTSARIISGTTVRMDEDDDRRPQRGKYHREQSGGSQRARIRAQAQISRDFRENRREPECKQSEIRLKIAYATIMIIITILIINVKLAKRSISGMAHGGLMFGVDPLWAVVIRFSGKGVPHLRNKK